MESTTLLYRPVGPRELQLIAQSDTQRFQHGFPASPSSIRCSTKNMQSKSHEIGTLLAQNKAPDTLRCSKSRPISWRHTQSIRSEVPFIKNIGSRQKTSPNSTATSSARSE